MLSDADRTRIAEAVATAETRTSGEVVCVLTGEVSDYPETPLIAAAGAALLAGPLLAPLAAPLAERLMSGGWTAAHAGGAGGLMLAYPVVQALVFGLGFLVARIAPVRRALTPAAAKRVRTHRAALAQFAASPLARVPGLTGVMIFASIADRRMELLAEAAIHEKAGPGAWDAVVAEAIPLMRAEGPAAGLVRAVERVGEILALHFPDDGGGNRLPDAVLEV